MLILIFTAWGKTAPRVGDKTKRRNRSRIVDQRFGIVPGRESVCLRVFVVARSQLFNKEVFVVLPSELEMVRRVAGDHQLACVVPLMAAVAHHGDI